VDETTMPPDDRGDAGGAQSTTEAALASLESLSERPLAEHPDVYQAIHTTLQDALADINDA
jgi:hypothetical protein